MTPFLCVSCFLRSLARENATFRLFSCAVDLASNGWTTLSPHGPWERYCKHMLWEVSILKKIQWFNLVTDSGFLNDYYCFLLQVFLSIKGIYYQAEVLGQTITWIIPYQFAHDVSRDTVYFSRLRLVQKIVQCFFHNFAKVSHEKHILHIFY